MKPAISRRRFLGTTSLLGAGVGLASLGGSPLLAAALAKGAPHAEKLGWRLGPQAYSFNRFTFSEAVDKAACLGLHVIEAYPGQKFSKEQEGAINEESSPELRKAIKQKLADSGIKLVNYGVCGLPADVDKSRRIFEFAKDMGIETIVSEPAEDAFDTVEKLCDEYEINVAIHNHPKPSYYWNPDTVLRVCKGRSKRIGACCDTGHWPRSGLKPLACLKKLEGRIISFHFKDLNKLGGDAHDVPWGTGVCDVKGMLAEIHRQGVKAVFSIEYEYHWENSLPEIAQCVKCFDKVAAQIAAQG